MRKGKRKCKSCKKPFKQQQLGQNVCSPACALTLVRTEREAKERQKQRERKQALRENDRSWQLKKTQEAFNNFIRRRDAGLPCISCGRFHNGQYHAGHFRTTAAQPSLRFNEMNCHKQCAPCNNHKSGNITEYRIELTRRVGPQIVEWLEKDHPTRKWSIDELKALRTYYRDALKAMPDLAEDLF